MSPSKRFSCLSPFFFLPTLATVGSHAALCFFSSSPNHKRTQLFATLLILQNGYAGRGSSWV